MTIRVRSVQSTYVSYIHFSAFSKASIIPLVTSVEEFSQGFGSGPEVLKVRLPENFGT